MKRIVLITLAALTGACSLVRGGGEGASLSAPIPGISGERETLFALEHVDFAIGTGAPAENGKCFFAHYTGWLTDGTQFDSSRDTTQGGTPRNPISFPQGYRRVINGWDLGFEGMRVGGKRRLIIPYQLAYGVAGRPPRIPERATLIFDVELMAVTDTVQRVAGRGGQMPTSPGCPSWASVSGG